MCVIGFFLGLRFLFSFFLRTIQNLSNFQGSLSLEAKVFENLPFSLWLSPSLPLQTLPLAVGSVLEEHVSSSVLT